MVSDAAGAGQDLRLIVAVEGAAGGREHVVAFVSAGVGPYIRPYGGAFDCDPLHTAALVFGPDTGGTLARLRGWGVHGAATAREVALAEPAACSSTGRGAKKRKHGELSGSLRQ
jgi:hypothetical protein